MVDRSSLISPASIMSSSFNLVIEILMVDRKQMIVFSVIGMVCFNLVIEILMVDRVELSQRLLGRFVSIS